ncbi:MAG: replication initiation protein [Defluviitaleaceae bacterium]|nr:replication initiation protein [Defluviitaleaceae bacterium]
MAKTCDLKVLNGNLSENYLVQKSVPILMMGNDPFSIGELKILDTYLALINSHDFKSRRVTFTKAEYEKLMGLSDVRIDQLKKYTDGVQSKIVEIKISDSKFKRITLFCETEFEKNEYGEWNITLECSPQAKRYIFHPDKVGYIKYLLKYSIHLKSKHSFLLYGYLLFNRFRGSWSEPLDFLKHNVFKLAPSAYNEFKIFRRDVLDKAISEVNKLTDIEFKYVTEKRGRTVVSIKFELIKEKDKYVEQLASDSVCDNFCEDDECDIENQNLDLLMDACNKKFSREQINELLQIIICKEIPEHKNGIWISRFHYLSQKYAILEHYASIKKIPNKFKYLKKIIEND